MKITPAPLRRRVVEEMHLRPGIDIRGPASAWQVLNLFAADKIEEQAAAAKAHFGSLTGSDNVGRHATFGADGISYDWELHSEACTATVIAAGHIGRPEQEVREWLKGFPGTILRAVKINIDLVGEEDDKPKGLRSDMVAGRLGSVAFFSSFSFGPDGLGRLRIFVREEARGEDVSRSVRQLQELGNYRNLALIGFDLVRAFQADLRKMEAKLASIVEDLGSTDALDALSDLAIDIARLREATSYRLGATEAYAEIVEDRLEMLHPSRVPGHQTLEEFIQRRFAPAMRTCQNFSVRLDSLAMRMAQASELLRTRIDTDLAQQNAAILASIGQTGRKQLQLQRLVEGLSVFAVAYYSLGIADYLLGGVPPDIGFEREGAMAALVLPTLLMIFLALRWQQSRLQRDDLVKTEPGRRDV